MRGRPLTEMEERHVARLASRLEDAENALYCPSPHEAEVPLAERNKAVSDLYDEMARYLNHISAGHAKGGTL